MTEVVIHKSNQLVTNSNVLNRFIDNLPDGKYLVQAKNIKRRSLNQNSYLHGVVIPLVYEGLRYAGWNQIRDHVDAKNVIKGLFLREKIVNESTGEVLGEIVKDTHKLTTTEMKLFVDEVIFWAAEFLSVQIPLPNEQTVLNYDN